MRVRWLVVVAMMMACGGDDEAGGDEAPAQEAETEASDEPSAAETEDATPPTSPVTPGEETSAGATTSDETTSGPSGAEASESGTGASTDSEGEGPGFASVYETVLVGRGCTNDYCHGGGDGYLFLNDESAAYDALVGVTPFDAACNLQALVAPGDANASVLWARLDPAGSPPSQCAQMPLEADALTATEAELVRAWIDGGAKR